MQQIAAGMAMTRQKASRSASPHLPANAPGQRSTSTCRTSICKRRASATLGEAAAKALQPKLLKPCSAAVNQTGNADRPGAVMTEAEFGVTQPRKMT